MDLTSRYIYGPLSDRNPCEKYPFIPWWRHMACF